MTNAPPMPTFGYRLFVAIVVLAVGAGIVGGLIISGSPSKERLRTLDRRRSDQINQLTNAVDSFYTNKGYLPPNLMTLQEDPASYAYVNSSFVDPATQVPYEYRVTSSSTFEICGIFDTDTSTDDTRLDPNTPDGPRYPAPHAAGRVCFPHTAVNWNKR